MKSHVAGGRVGRGELQRVQSILQRNLASRFYGRRLESRVFYMIRDAEAAVVVGVMAS